MEEICLTLSFKAAAEVPKVKPWIPRSFCWRTLEMIASPIVIPTVPPRVLEIGKYL